MRTIHVDEIRDTVARLCWEACYYLPPDILEGFKKAEATEVSPLGKTIITQLIENVELAASEHTPYCHDTGLAVETYACHITALPVAVNIQCPSSGSGKVSAIGCL